MRAVRILKARTNIKFMIKCGWKNGEIIEAFMRTMLQRNRQFADG